MARDANSHPGGQASRLDPRIEKAIAERTPQIVGGAGELIHTPSGPIYGPRRKYKRLRTICDFGSVVGTTDPDNPAGVKGGAITCGDKNFAVADYPFPLDTPGTWLVEVSISGIEVQTDDDDSLILPGIVTATGTPAWNLIVYTGSENYTSNTNPATPTSSGTVILPIGVLTVAGGTASIANTGCGAFIVDQCAGILTYGRPAE